MPKDFLPFTGQWLDGYGGHIHYVINGYKPLTWAIPLEIDTFSVKKINEFTNIVEAFHAFCKIINLETKIFVNTQQKLFL